jgi:hypothetical protein
MFGRSLSPRNDCVASSDMGNSSCKYRIMDEIVVISGGFLMGGGVREKSLHLLL